MNTPTTTLKSLETSLRERLEDCKGDILTSPNPEDTLYEQVDMEVPVYNADLLEVCDNSPWLGLDTPNLECANAFNSIKANIYDHLLEIAHEWLALNRLN